MRRLHFTIIVRNICLVSLLLIVLNSCSLVFPVLAPFQDPPQPTGPYGVGTRVDCWVDSSRDEFFTPDPDYRRLVLQVWYPVSKTTSGEVSTYIDTPNFRIPALAKQLRLPRSVIQHVQSVKTHAIFEASPCEGSDAFPVILFSHGLSGMRFQNTALIEDLVSHGYVVLAPDHSYDANVAVFKDGIIAEYRAGKRRVLKGANLAKIDKGQLRFRVEDLRFMIDRLQKTERPELLRNIPLDADRIGLMGHSLGGTSIIAAMATDQRVRAGLVLDGWYLPLPDSILEKGATQPLLHLGQKGWDDPENYVRMDTFFSHVTAPQYKILVPGTMHTDFTDMPLFSPFSYWIGYTASENPEWMIQFIRRITRDFFESYLRQVPPASFHAFLRSQKGVDVYFFSP